MSKGECSECGLPVEACSRISILEREVKRLSHALKKLARETADEKGGEHDTTLTTIPKSPGGGG